MHENCCIFYEWSFQTDFTVDLFECLPVSCVYPQNINQVEKQILRFSAADVTIVMLQ